MLRCDGSPYFPLPLAEMAACPGHPAGAPERSRETVRAAVDEYESRLTPESLCAKDADKLERLLQAIEYRDIGVHRVEAWIESARNDLKTRTGQRIAEAAVAVSPLAWRDR